MLLLTVCTICQLPQAIALAHSLRQYEPDPVAWPVVIGLADDPAHLPAGFSLPAGVSLLTLADWLPEPVAVVSARYTPAEFVTAVKPGFIRAALRRFATAPGVLYADPASFLYSSPGRVETRLAGQTLLLTPHLSRPPADARQPDEKYLQNVGLYSAGWLAVGRGPETDQLLTWWQDRTLAHGAVDFCAGTCADQLWLMHTPTLFAGVVCHHDPAWQVALWNLPERRLSRTTRGTWAVSGPDGLSQPLVSANFCGLTDPGAGYFQQQNRFDLRRRADVQALLAEYQTALARFADATLTTVAPAYGDRPARVVLTGWRHWADDRLKQLIGQIETLG